MQRVAQDGVRAGLLLRFASVEFAIMGMALALSVALSRTGAPEGSVPPGAVTSGSAAARAQASSSLGIAASTLAMIKNAMLRST